MLIALASAAAAGAAAGPSGTTAFLFQIVPLALVFLIFWFLILRPQQKRAADHKSMVEGAKKGDTVVTGGGLIGKVTKVEDDAIEVEIAPNVRVRAVKGSLTDVTPLGGKKAAND